MNILGLDPGKNNFAYAVVSSQGLETTGLLPTVKNLHPTELTPAVKQFVVAVDALVTTVDYVAFERMQSRPGFGGGQVVETINLMIGLVCGAAARHDVPLYPVNAMTWKTHWRKAYGLPKERFAMATTKLRITQPKGTTPKTKTELVEGVLGNIGVSIHEADAIGIAAYCWHRQIGGDLLSAIRQNV